MEELIKLVKELVAEARLEDALKAAKQGALNGYIELDTPVTLLQSELAYLNRSNIRGLYTREEYGVQLNIISQRLLDLINKPGQVDAPMPAGQKSKTNTLLFLGANPLKNLALELDREMQEISEGLKRFGQRAAFDFRAQMHVSPADVQRLLLEDDLNPGYVHFAGNAVVDHPEYGTGILFEDENGDPQIVGGDALAVVLKQFPDVHCVFLNTCDSGPSAMLLGKQMPYVVGMNAKIYDLCAIDFGVAFYEAIARGKDVPFAFEYARGRLLLGKYPEQASIPVLIADGKASGPLYVP